MAQPHQTPTQSPPAQGRQDSLISLSDMDMNNLSAPAAEVTPEEAVVARSSSEEKDTLTPQQSRRKAQNRAA